MDWSSGDHIDNSRRDFISEREPTAKQPTEDFKNSAEMEPLAAAIAGLGKFQQKKERRCTEEQEREAE